VQWHISCFFDFGPWRLIGRISQLALIVQILGVAIATAKDKSNTGIFRSTKYHVSFVCYFK
jgi:hypothetical protein